MADAVLDFAAVETAMEDSAATTDTSTTDTSVDNQSTTDTSKDSATDNTSDKHDNSDVLNEDGTPKTEAQKQAEAEGKTNAVKNDAPADGKATPDSISKILKAVKDSDPKNAGAAKVLRDSYFGEQAFKKEFPSVQAAREAKAFIESIGGPEGWESAQSTLKALEDTDKLVQEGNPQIWNNIIDDLKAQNHLEALPKLVAGGLDALKAQDQAKYSEAIVPHSLAYMESVNLPKAIVALDKYLKMAEQELTTAEYKGEAKGIGALKTIVSDMNAWIKEVQDDAKAKADTTTKVDPERLKLEEDRKAFIKQQEDAAQAKTKEFQANTAKELESYSNTTLGKSLSTFLVMPFFKGMPQSGPDGGHAAWKVNLGNGIKARLYDALENDKAYQTSMRAQWSQKNPDKAKIAKIHNDTIDAISEDIVREEVEARYPNYAKGGSAAGRATAQTVKKEADTKAAKASTSSGKPIYVSVKPKDLVRQTVRVAGKEYSPSDLTTLEITGKGFVKSADGKTLKYVTWRK